MQHYRDRRSRRDRSSTPVRNVRKPNTLCKRVLSLQEYQLELAEIDRNRIQPRDEKKSSESRLIPVPLWPGEDMSGYERHFLSWLRQKGHSPRDYKYDANRERSLRISFALYHTKHAPSVKDLLDAPLSTKRPSSASLRDDGRCLLKKQAISGDHGRSSRSISSDHTKHSKSDESTEDDVEYKVQQSQKISADHSYKDSSISLGANVSPATNSGGKHHENVLQLENRDSDEKKNEASPDSSAVSSTSEIVFGPTPCSAKLPTESSASLASFVTSYNDCRCGACLWNCMQRITKYVTSLETRQLSVEASDTRQAIVNLTPDQSGKTIPSSHQISLGGPAKRVCFDLNDDPIEYQLWHEYNSINERIIDNECVVRASLERLQVIALEEATERLRDVQELRSFIKDESSSRRLAIARLLVYRSTNCSIDLEKGANETNTVDIPHIQQVCHEKCATIQVTLMTKFTYITQLKQQVDDLLMRDQSLDPNHLDELTRIGELIATAEKEVHELKENRLRELTTLLHFDEQLRKHVRSQLP